MKRFGEQPDLHFDEKELKTDLGKDNFIFVGSSSDMWANAIPNEWIWKTLDHCRKFENQYLFQSKFPVRFLRGDIWLPKPSIIGTTIETNRHYPEMGRTLPPQSRIDAMKKVNARLGKTIVTIEPICDFDLEPLIEMFRDINPSWVNIGANTNHKVKLPEPGPGKIKELISALKEFTEVKIKPNLKRLLT